MMIEWELAWRLTDDQAEELKREIMAMIQFVLCRRRSARSRGSDTSRTIDLAAVVETLAFFIAAYASSEEDDQTIEELLEVLTDILKRSVRQIKAADAAQKLIARASKTGKE